MVCKQNSKEEAINCNKNKKAQEIEKSDSELRNVSISCAKQSTKETFQPNEENI